jgi:hypothetical protein
MLKLCEVQVSNDRPIIFPLVATLSHFSANPEKIICQRGLMASKHPSSGVVYPTLSFTSQSGKNLTTFQ